MFALSIYALKVLGGVQRGLLSRSPLRRILYIFYYIPERVGFGGAGKDAGADADGAVGKCPDRLMRERRAVKPRPNANAVAVQLRSDPL